MNPIKKWWENYSKKVNAKFAAYDGYVKLLDAQDAAEEICIIAKLNITEKSYDKSSPWIDDETKNQKACVYNFITTYDTTYGPYDYGCQETPGHETVRYGKCPYFKSNSFCDQINCTNIKKNNAYNITHLAYKNAEDDCKNYLAGLSQTMRNMVLRRDKILRQKQL